MYDKKNKKKNNWRQTRYTWHMVLYRMYTKYLNTFPLNNLVNISEDNILIFFCFIQKIGFDSTVCMKYQSISRGEKRQISTICRLALRMVKVNSLQYLPNTLNKSILLPLDVSKINIFVANNVDSDRTSHDAYGLSLNSLLRPVRPNT